MGCFNFTMSSNIITTPNEHLQRVNSINRAAVIECGHCNLLVYLHIYRCALHKLLLLRPRHERMVVGVRPGTVYFYLVRYTSWYFMVTIVNWQFFLFPVRSFDTKWPFMSTKHLCHHLSSSISSAPCLSMQVWHRHDEVYLLWLLSRSVPSGCNCWRTELRICHRDSWGILL